MGRFPWNDPRDGWEAESKKKHHREDIELGRRPNGLGLASLIISLFAVELTLAAGPHNAHLSCQSAEGCKPENSYAALSARHWKSTVPLEALGENIHRLSLPSAGGCWLFLACDHTKSLPL